MYQQDYIKRQIEMLARALASIVGKRRAGEHEEALAEVRDAYGLAGLDPGLLRLPPHALASLIREPEKLPALADLLEEEARIRAALGQESRATELRTRADALRRAAARPIS